MGYSEIQKLIAPVESDFDTAAADVYTFAFRRRGTVVGWGIQLTEATDAAQAQAAIHSLDYTPAPGGSRVEKDALTMPASSPVGKIYERSALLKDPVSPEANLTPFDVAAGGLVHLRRKTAATSGEAGKGFLYVLFVPKGSI